MGDDGGSVPDHRDLVRGRPKAERADRANQTKARWLFCALSKVSCALGKLYNEDAIVEYLLDKLANGDGENVCGHIRSLKIQPLTPLTDDTCLSSHPWRNERGATVPLYIQFSSAGLKTVTACASPEEKEKDSAPAEGDDKAPKLKLCPQSAKKCADDDVIPSNPPSKEELTMRFNLLWKSPQKRRKNDSSGEPPTKKSASLPG